jgi:GTP-binding protein Era
MAKSGFVALIGRPNSGKSTLLNRLLGEKISIVSDKPQTTRHKILGILTREEGQIIFVDTPGIHKPGFELNKRMMQAVYDSLEGADLLLLLVDAATSFGQGDQFVLDLIKRQKCPALLLLNKTDKIAKENLLPIISRYSQEHSFAEIVPLSALKGDNVDLLLKIVLTQLPEGPAYYPGEQYTDRPERFLAAEIVREKLLHHTQDELPYSSTVWVTQFEDKEEVAVIHCEIYVDKDSHKKMVIGSRGAKLKQIGCEARPEIEQMLGKRVYLELYVRVRPRWRDDPRFLDSLSIEDLNTQLRQPN